MSVPIVTDWVLTTQQLPPRATPADDYSELVDVVVVNGFVNRRITQARYSYQAECWQNTQEVFGLSAWNWVTHWQPMRALPEPVSKEAILAHIQVLEPDYSEAKSKMRALFADVDPADGALQDQLYQTIARTGLQGTRVLGRGTIKGNQYYVDFWVSEALHLRQVKHSLNQVPVAHTVRPRG